MSSELRTLAGTVTSTDPLAVRFSGDADAVEGVLPMGHAPVVGETVVMLQVGPSWVIVGGDGSSDFTGWATLSLVNGWGSLSTSTYGSPAYRKLSSGLVVMKGLVVGTSATDDIVATLPVGHRPVHRNLYHVGAGSNTAVQRFDVDTNGNLITASRSGWLSLGPITFLAEQ